MSGEGKVVAGVLGAVVALTLILAGLKLGHAIAWPWVWVVSPLWVLGILALGLAGYVLVDDVRDTRRQARRGM